MMRVDPGVYRYIPPRELALIEQCVRRVMAEEYARICHPSHTDVEDHWETVGLIDELNVIAYEVAMVLSPTPVEVTPPWERLQS